MPTMSMTRLSALTLLSLAMCCTTALAAQPLPRGLTPSFAPSGAKAPVSASTQRARRALRSRFGRHALLDADEQTGGVRILGRLDGLLTAEDSRPDRTIAMDFLKGHKTVLGLDDADVTALQPTRKSSSGGLSQVDWVQSYRGLQNIDSLVRVNLTATGEIVNVQARSRSDLSLASVTPAISAGDAYRTAAAGLGDATPRQADGEAKLVIFEEPTGPRLGWRLLVPVDSTHVYDVVVDAMTGELERSSNYVREYTADVIRNYPSAPVGGTSQTVNMNAYLNPGTAVLDGPYAHTVADPKNLVYSPDTKDKGAEIGVASGDFRFPLTFTGSCALPCIWDPGTMNSWQPNQARDAAQIHWFVSNFHDYLANTPAIAFNAANNNFEGADRVVAQSMDGANLSDGFPASSSVNNANMATYPEGTPALMQMYLTNVLGGQSTGMDAAVIYHEYTHGMVARSIVDATGTDAARGPQGSAIHEAVADWFSADYLHSADSGALETDSAAIGDVTLGKYTFGSVRTQPTDCPVGAAATACPESGTAGPGGYTYGDFGKILGVPEVHADGEIMGQAMWSLRQALIAKHGATTGEAHVRRMLASGLRLTPPHPTFLDLRNAVLQADAAAALGDSTEIWQAFAERGMGYFASSEGTDDIHPIEDFRTPPGAAAGTGTVIGTVTDAGTGVGQAGIKVAFGGHDTGVGPDLAGTTAGDGQYTIANVPTGTYPLLRAFGAATGFETARVTNVVIGSGAVLTHDFSLRRNVASQQSGGTVHTFTGQTFLQCGPQHAIDGARATGWLTHRPGFVGGEKELTVKLPVAIKVGDVTIDPTPACGLGPEAGLGAYDVQVSADDHTYTTVASGTFTKENVSNVNHVTLTGTPANTRYVRLVAKGAISEFKPGAAFQEYMSMAELGVYAAAGEPRAPVVTAAAADAVADTSATLHGSVNPNGTATDYQFEWGTSVLYGNAAPATPAALGSGATAVAVSQALTGLAANKRYYFRVNALRNGVVVESGAAKTFTTGSVLPLAATGDATNVTQTAAQINGTVDPRGVATSYRFEWGPTASYGNVVPQTAELVGSGTGDQPVAADLSGLAPGTTYHFRVSAIRNGAVAASGTDRTFTTAAADPDPVVTTQEATDRLFQSAQLNGTIDPNGVPTTYHFEFGLTTDYGDKTADASAGSGTDPIPVSATAAPLGTNTTYHYRLVGLRGATRFVGPDRSFTTQPQRPTVMTDGATQQGPTTFTLAGLIGAYPPVDYQFEWGTDGSYGNLAPAVPETIEGSANVQETLTGLAPATTYHFRLVAYRGTTRYEGVDMTFTTGAAQPPAAFTGASAAVVEGGTATAFESPLPGISPAPVFPALPRGSAGRVSLDCEVTGRSVRCTSRIAGAAGRQVTITVSQGGRVVARGKAVKARRRGVRLRGRRGLRAGKVTVTAKVRVGSKVRTIRTRIVLR